LGKIYQSLIDGDNFMTFIGIDLGGSKIEGVLLSRFGEQLKRLRAPTPLGDYDEILSAIVAMVNRLEADTGTRSTVGIGTPGSLSAVDGSLKNSNTTCLNGRYVQQDLEFLLDRKIRLANDANCFALSEAVDGAGEGKNTVFGVILGTGVGGGLVINQQLLRGPNAIGSEWGHNVLPGIGVEFVNQRRACYCGRQNCIETYLSGPGFAKTYQAISGQQRPAIDVAALAASGDTDACSALTLYQQQLAYALSQVINIIDPDVIVLGGGMSNVSSLYDVVPLLWRDAIFSDQVKTPLMPAKFGDSSGVRGAARLWMND
jgi:fructokinase